MRKKRSRFIQKWQVIKVGDILSIPFAGVEPTVAKVTFVNRRKKILRCEILQEQYPNSAFKVGDVVNLGDNIFKGFWAFVHEKGVIK